MDDEQARLRAMFNMPEKEANEILEKYKNVEDIALKRMIRDYLDMPVCKWDLSRRDDWKSIGMRIPKCQCNDCKAKRKRR